MTIRHILRAFIGAFLLLAVTVGIVFAPLEYGGFTLNTAWAQSLPNPVYLCKCDTGAHGDCAANAGSDAVAIGSTSAATPRATITGAQFNALAAGTRVLMCRGGRWLNMSFTGGGAISNTNATELLPVGFDEYVPPNGTPTGRPRIHLTGGGHFAEFGPFCGANDAQCFQDGGYFFRNLEVTSATGTNYAFWTQRGIRYVIIENLKTSGFALAFHLQSGLGEAAVNGFVLRNSEISAAEMGLLAGTHDMLIEDNLWHDINNAVGSNGNHAIYTNARPQTNQRGTIRRNTFTNISAVDGVCTGGHITVHGQLDGLTIEDNVMVAANSTLNCVGVSITRGYDTTEFFRNMVVRGNTIVNVGICVTWSGAPGIVVEGNKCTWTIPQGGVGMSWPSIFGGSAAVNDADGNVLIRNNTCTYTNLSLDATARCISVNPPHSGTSAGTGNRVVNNVAVLRGTGSVSSRSCWGTIGGSNAPRSIFSEWDNNLCYVQGGRWSDTYADHQAARVAGFDLWSAANGPAWSDPLFVNTPASANSWDCSVQAASPVIDAGHPTLSMLQSRTGLGVDGTRRDIGACERNKDPN
jgi:hypothetical protein